MDLKTEIKITEELISSAKELREKFWRDPHRPCYHFMPPAAWMNDINGTIFWKGRYHIFYQHNPDGAYWKWMQWGHASSIDLVHWTHHPIALTPTLEGADRDGCFSGGAVVNNFLPPVFRSSLLRKGLNGVPTFIYHGVPEGTCIATSEDDDLIKWAKHAGNPVIPVPEPDSPDFGKYAVYDPCAWKRGDTYYALCGGLDPQGGDTAYLFKSPDMIHWEYLNPFYKSDRRWTEVDEDCAVPNFFPIGSKYMLLFCSHLQGTQYYIGRYEGDQFYPESHARMSWPGGLLGGGITMLDGKGRRLFFDWIRGIRGVDAERASGWSGVMTLPRVLSLPDDSILRIEPAPELEILRYNSRKFENIRLSANSELPLSNVSGDCLEMALEIEPEDAGEFGLKVRCSPDGEEQTAVAYSFEEKSLKVYVSKSSLDENIRYYYYRNQGALDRLPESERIVKAQKAPFELKAGETLKLRIFLDRSVLEVFANGRQCITQRIYPTRSDSLRVVLFSGSGSLKVRSVEAWDMAPAVQ